MRSPITGAALMLTYLLAGSVYGAEGPGTAAQPPRWAVRRLLDEGIATWPAKIDRARFEVSRHLNPYYLQGDFDGDCRTDLAILVKRHSDGKLGIAVLLQADHKARFLGAGTAVGSGGDDFRWMDMWYVYQKQTVAPNGSGDRPPDLRGDALFVEKSESASGLIYYDGSKFRWYQLSD